MDLFTVDNGLGLQFRLSQHFIWNK